MKSILASIKFRNFINCVKTEFQVRKLTVVGQQPACNSRSKIQFLTLGFRLFTRASKKTNKMSKKVSKKSLTDE